MEGQNIERDYYLRLTKDEIETIKYALQTQYANSDNINFTGEENDDLVLKISLQTDSICRPYVVSGIHHVGVLNLPTKVVVMAEEPKWAIEYAKEKLERRDGGTFEANPEDVHEMSDDEFLEVRE